MKYKYIIIYIFISALSISCSSNIIKCLDDKQNQETLLRLHRLENLNSFWEEKTSVEVEKMKSDEDNEIINYPAGLYKEILFSSRTSNSDDLIEPIR